jgi:hypothetical protein
MQTIEMIRFSRVWAGLTLLAAASFGQNGVSLFEKAPAGIDEALRARITQFYQLHVDGKFRAADALVAEESKDAFFMADKTRCRSFQIIKINYSDDYTRATAAVSCDTDLVLPIGVFPVKMPIGSKWKAVDGQWMWYTDPVSEKGLATPIGVDIPANKEPAAAGPSPAPPGMATGPVDLEGVSRLVNADRQRVTFDPATAGEQRVVVANGMPGRVTLTLQPAQLEGFELSLDRTSLEQGQSAALSIRYNPSPDRRPTAATVNVVVAPVFKTIPIQIRFGSSSPAPQMR